MLTRYRTLHRDIFKIWNPYSIAALTSSFSKRVAQVRLNICIIWKIVKMSLTDVTGHPNGGHIERGSRWNHFEFHMLENCNSNCLCEWFKTVTIMYRQVDKQQILSLIWNDDCRWRNWVSDYLRKVFSQNYLTFKVSDVKIFKVDLF